MELIIEDPKLIAALSNNGPVKLVTSDGLVLGDFQPEAFGMLPPGFVIDLPEETLIEIRKQKTGRPLADIMKDLEARQ